MSSMPTEVKESEASSKSYFKDSKRTLTEDYTVEGLLGDGAFSVVHRAKRNSDRVEVAIKIIEKNKVSHQDLDREVEIWRLASSSSSRVVQLHEIYEDIKNVYLIMELMIGGELFEKIANMTDYSEPYAAKIMKQVFLIIRDLHKVDIIHQDLKPENLLLMSKESMILKLCDFGLAEIADDDTELFGCVGSTTYMAPEVTNESGHHKPVDIYAAGVIMYIMLCGYPPFEPENGIVDLEFPEREWQDISPAAKGLIVSLLNSDPEKRPKPEEILKHQWFHDVETIRNPKTLAKAAKTLQKFQEMGPNGTMREYRGDTKGNRSSVIGLFDDDTPTTNTDTVINLAALYNYGTSPKQEERPNNIKKNGKKVSKNQKGNTKSTPQLPAITIPQQQRQASSSPKKKSGARSDRANRTRSKETPQAQKIDTENKDRSKEKDNSESVKKKKKNNSRKKRASTSLVSIIQQTGHVDIDPKGLFTKEDKKKLISPNDQEELEKLELIISSSHDHNGPKKKKDDRRAQKKPTNHNKKWVKKKDSSGYSGNAALEDIISSFQRELSFQNELLDIMKNEAVLLNSKIKEETDKRTILLEQLNAEIVVLRKEADEERKERRLLQATLESLLNNHYHITQTSSNISANPKSTHSSSTNKDFHVSNKKKKKHT